jgi:hypothetical protein
MSVNVTISPPTSVGLSILTSPQQNLNLTDSLNHNYLGNIQGGSLGEYYHLSSGEYFNLITGKSLSAIDTEPQSVAGQVIFNGNVGFLGPFVSIGSTITGPSWVIQPSGETTFTNARITTLRVINRLSIDNNVGITSDYWNINGDGNASFCNISATGQVTFQGDSIYTSTSTFNYNASAATAHRNALGLGVGQTPTFGGLNITGDIYIGTSGVKLSPNDSNFVIGLSLFM